MAWIWALAELHKTFKAWNETPELESFLIEITADIFTKMDDDGEPLGE
jgi:6-phosphogluconate dehydrogenase